jgi:nicotinamidase-related amidase
MTSSETHQTAPTLSQLVEPEHCVLLLQELQNGVVGPDSGLPALAAAVEEVGLVKHAIRLVEAARRSGVTVVHCTAQNLPDGFGVNRNARLFAAARRAGMENLPGSESVQPIAELAPVPGDLVLPRFHGLSPMHGSPLDQLLRNAGISTVVVIGVSLNVAIPNLVFDAVNRSYQVVVVSDAVAGVPPEYGQQVLQNTLAPLATIATAEQLIEAWTDR